MDCWTCALRRCIAWRRRDAADGVTPTRHESGNNCSTSGGMPGLFEREALRGLAVHQEHRLKDTGRALMFARRAYAEARTAPGRLDGQTRVTRLERRLTELAASEARLTLTADI